MRIGLIIILFFVCLRYSQAQDLHFSQYNENPSLINPAFTGVSNVLRVSAVYRDQWRTVTVPYKTYGISVESRIMASNWSKVEGQSMTFTKKSFSKVAAGLSFYSDKAGDGSMRTDQLKLSLASFVPINAYNRLSLGVQAGFIQRKVDLSKLVFSNQYNGMIYDSNIAHGESGSSQ